MTYTYKLARRLAISRNLAMLPVLVLFAACAGETTAPDAGTTPTTPAAPHTPIGFRVLPGTVTIETNQRIRFRGELRTLRGQVSTPRLYWEASGGSIDSMGNFAAASPGTYRIVARGIGRGRTHPQRPDTSLVVVVPPQPGLLDINVTPRRPRLEIDDTITFTAMGRLSDGTDAAIGVNWTATGGTIDPAGAYQAGSTPGRFLVIATNTEGSVADTVSVRIRMPEPVDTASAPPPDPTPEPEPEPALTRVVLKPATVFLATAAGQQFAAFGRNTAGDSVAVDVTFRATGGTITSTGLYTAGPTAGTYRVIATSGALADTSVVTLAQTSGGETPAPSTGTGIPFALWALLAEDAPKGAFSGSLDAYTASNIQSRLAEARSKKVRVLMNMTGGSHDKYKTDGVFDIAKWRATMDSYNTPTIRAAVAEAVSDWIIIGNSVMDEPHNTTDHAGWGGTLTKARVDEMCRYVQNIFPTLPVGVVHDHRRFEPEKNYQSCEFIVSQYRLSKGDVQDFRDGGLAFARRSGIAIAFSLNILHGGDTGTTCEKYGYDPQGILCPMTGAQVREWGQTLGTAGCALTVWKYEQPYFDRPDVQDGLRSVGEALAKLPGKSCRRP
jgi:hypothetical protein